MKLIFYTLYRWASRYNYWDTPHLSALYFLSLFVTFNILSVYVYIKIILGYSPGLLEYNKIIYIALFVIITAIIYLLYVKNKKYHIIANKYKENKNFKKSKANALTIIYLIVTLSLFFSLGFYRIKH